MPDDEGAPPTATRRAAATEYRFLAALARSGEHMGAATGLLLMVLFGLPQEDARCLDALLQCSTERNDCLRSYKPDETEPMDWKIHCVFVARKCMRANAARCSDEVKANYDAYLQCSLSRSSVTCWADYME